MVKVNLFQNTSFLYFQGVLESEYFFGLNQFQAIGDASQSNLTGTQIDFLSENINLLVLYAESLTNKSQELFNRYGFVINAKQLYSLVFAVRQRTVDNINHLMIENSANQIRRNLSKIYQKFSEELKSVFDKEILKIRSAAKIDEDALDCWDSYKIPLFELGYDVVSALELSALNEAENLMRKLDEARQNVSSAINQIITDLSMTPSTAIFPARSRTNTYVSSILIPIIYRRQRSNPFRSKTIRRRFSSRLMFGSNKLALRFDKHQKTFRDSYAQNY